MNKVEFGNLKQFVDDCRFMNETFMIARFLKELPLEERRRLWREFGENFHMRGEKPDYVMLARAILVKYEVVYDSLQKIISVTAGA